jgi:ABC-type nitrate/sulfonate/bicarbonate transport system permease component
VIKNWYGYNENSMKIQIYIALICNILIKMLSEKIDIDYIALKRILQINLLELSTNVRIFSG